MSYSQTPSSLPSNDLSIDEANNGAIHQGQMPLNNMSYPPQQSGIPADPYLQRQLPMVPPTITASNENFEYDRRIKIENNSRESHKRSRHQRSKSRSHSPS